MLNPDEREELLRLARAAIGSSLGLHSLAEAGLGAGLQRLAGAFVTLHHLDRLRGCIGYLESDRPLVDVVARCAVSASNADPRFPPLARSEFPEITLEISVLGPIEPVADVNEIEIGRHGLIVQAGPARGLLLPQVATERGWNRETFLGYTCLKAGLASNAWKTGVLLFKFEAEVFGER